jgi:ESCRT-I complex subunit VPS37
MYSQHYNGPPASSQATFDAALSFLKQLNAKELQDLMDDTDGLNKMVDELEIVKTQEMEKETHLASNKSIAEYNLSREPRLIQQRQQLAETYDQAIQIQKDVEKNKLKLDSCSSGTSLDTTFALLQTEAAKSEEESEVCAETFLSQRSDVEEFLQKYIALRTKAHLRKVKVEKMSELVRDHERQKTAPVPAPRPAPQPPYSSPYSAPYSAPTNGWPGAPSYPINPANFPMPSAAAYR